MLTSWDILIKLVSSTKNIKTLIELWVTDKGNNPSLCNNVFFISDSECNKIYNIYYTAKQECQDTWTWDKIKKAATNFKFAKDWIQKWKDAWALLTWNTNSDKYKKLEKKLLSQELSRQWVPTNQAAQILKNTITNIISPEQKNELKKFKNSIFSLFMKLLKKQKHHK